MYLIYAKNDLKMRNEKLSKREKKRILIMKTSIKLFGFKDLLTVLLSVLKMAGGPEPPTILVGLHL